MHLTLIYKEDPSHIHAEYTNNYAQCPMQFNSEFIKLIPVNQFQD